MICIILNSLPDEYSNIIAIIDNIPDQDRPKPSGQRPRCSNCNKLGHRTEKCRQYCTTCKNKEHWTDQCRVVKSANATSSGQWIVDSGATDHMSNDKDFFKSLSSQNFSIRLADNSSILCKGIGSLELPKLGLSLDNVLFVPELSKSLLSVSALTKSGFTITFHGSLCTISKDERSVSLNSNGNLYQANNTSSETIHERLGHLSHKSVLSTLSKDLYDGDFAPLDKLCVQSRTQKERSLVPEHFRWPMRFFLLFIQMCGDHSLPQVLLEISTLYHLLMFFTFLLYLPHVLKV